MPGSLCSKRDQLFIEEIGRCEDCGTVCHKDLPLTKCPRKCLQFLYENAMDMITKLRQETGNGNEWSFNNWSIVLVSIIGGGFLILLMWLAWKKRDKFTCMRRIKLGCKKLDLEMGVVPSKTDEEEVLIEDQTNTSTPVVPYKNTDSSMQTDEKVMEDKATQVDKLPVEEIGHDSGEPNEQEVKSPAPTTSEKITEEVYDNHKPKEVLDDCHFDDAVETTVKRPFTGDQATGEVAVVSSECNPQDTLSSNLDNLNDEEQSSLGATGGYTSD